MDISLIPKAVADNVTASATLRSLNLRPAGGNFTSLYAKIAKLKLDTSHWLGKENFKKGSWTAGSKQFKLEDLLVENSNYNRGKLKARLIKEGIIANQCAICKLGPIWLDKPLTLQIDHINGMATDNRLQNLRLLCPNCHTQTESFAGRRSKKNWLPRLDSNEEFLIQSQT